MKQSPYLNSNQVSFLLANTGRGLAIGVLMLVAFFCGCKNSSRPTTIPVSGTVTFDGEPPKYVGALYFAPLEIAEGYPKRGGRAIFELDGKFAATSFEDGDGLVPGTYKVRIECWSKPPGMGGSAGVSALPKKFEAPNVVVSEDERSVTYDLDVK